MKRLSPQIKHPVKGTQPFKSSAISRTEAIKRESEIVKNCDKLKKDQTATILRKIFKANPEAQKQAFDTNAIKFIIINQLLKIITSEFEKQHDEFLTAPDKLLFLANALKTRCGNAEKTPFAFDPKLLNNGNIKKSLKKADVDKVIEKIVTGAGQNAERDAMNVEMLANRNRTVSCVNDVLEDIRLKVREDIFKFLGIVDPYATKYCTQEEYSPSFDAGEGEIEQWGEFMGASNEECLLNGLRERLATNAPTKETTHARKARELLLKRMAEHRKQEDKENKLRNKKIKAFDRNIASYNEETQRIVQDIGGFKTTEDVPCNLLTALPKNMKLQRTKVEPGAKIKPANKVKKIKK